MLPNDLYTIITNDVYEHTSIREVSKNGSEKEMRYIFDFKYVSLRKDFIAAFAREFWQYIEAEELSNVQVGGMETGAIPLLAGLSLHAPQHIKTNFFYIRKSRKRHDLARVIEGNLDKNQPCILVDDIINRGGTLRKQLLILKNEGYTVSHFFACLRFRDLTAYREFSNEGIKLKTIFSLDDLSAALPVQNLTDTKLAEIFSVYNIVRKIHLTDKPNLYIVVPKSAPLLVDHLLYVGTDEGYMVCIDTKTEQIIWSFKTAFGTVGKYIFSSAAYFGKYLVFGAYDGNVYCLDRFTGEKIWVNLEADWVGSSPAINAKKGVVYVGLEYGLFNKKGGLIAIDIKTGKTLWVYRDMVGLTHASPAYSVRNDIVMCGCNDGYMRAFAAKTGTLLWELKTGGEIKYSVSFDALQNLAVFGSFDKQLYVVRVTSGEIVATFATRGEIYATPIFFKQTVIVGSLDKIVYCFDLETKTKKWEVNTFGRIFCSPLFDKKENTIFIGSNDGILYELDAATGERLAQTQFPDRIVNPPQVVYEGLKKSLWVYTHIGDLFKIVRKSIKV